MDFFQVAEIELGQLRTISIDELKSSEEVAGINPGLIDLVPLLVGPLTIYAAAVSDVDVDPLRVLLSADGVYILRHGDDIRLDYKESTNSHIFARLAAKNAWLKFCATKSPPPSGTPHLYNLETCESSRVHINPATGDFMSQSDSDSISEAVVARRITLEPSLTEVVYDEIAALASNSGRSDLHFRVVGSMYRINRASRVYRERSRDGFPRDLLSDELIDSQAYDVGDFEFGDRRLHRQAQRIVRNIVIENGTPTLRVSLAALSAVMNFHLMIAMIPEFEVHVETEEHACVAPGFTFLLKTSKMAVCFNSEQNLYITLPGIDDEIKQYAGTIMKPYRENLSEPVVVTIAKDFLWLVADKDRVTEDLEAACMESAILHAKLGDLPRAQLHLALVALRKHKSKLAAHMLSSSISDLPDELEDLIEEAEDTEEEEEDLGHLAITDDLPRSVPGRGMVGSIAVKKRGMRRIGVEHAYPMVLVPKRGYKLEVAVVQDEDRSWRVKAKLITPLRALVQTINSITGISILGFEVTRSPSKKTYEVCQTQAANSMLGGYFGYEGFQWITCAILSNRVEVDDRSDAISFLPRNKVHFLRGGLMLTESLDKTVHFLNCVTDMRRDVLVYWGPQLGAVKLRMGGDNQLVGKPTGQQPSKEGWKRCELSRRYVVQ